MSVFDRWTIPPSAAALGWAVVSEDPEAGSIEVSFDPGPQFLNPHGTIQGGYVAAMLDETMGPALLVASNGAIAPVSLDLQVSFVAPVVPGRVIGRGRVVHRGRSIAFLEAELFGEDGTLLARGTSTARIVSVG